MSRILGSDVGATVLAQDIYEISATQKHRLGTKLVRGDRVFKYGKAMNAFADTQHLAYSYYHQHIMYALIQAAAVAGDSAIAVTVAATDGADNDGAFLVDALEGGYVVIFDASSGEWLNYAINNSTVVAAGGGTITITLDGELPIALTTSDHVEVMSSPYTVIVSNGGGTRGFMGLPMRLATLASPYHWLQTWGPCWVSPNGRVGAAQYKNACVARNDGSIDIVSGESAMTADGQPVGFVLTYSQAGGQGAPFIMLQISH
ncbi:hypothetical protein LCGC14_0712610 [marine sediment metagenome]|uniref:Uncharacterized protein n=1 Tax=marine sediment metagenome TaxID=412755 RepID=A0A0F9QEM0_9ZZZZ